MNLNLIKPPHLWYTIGLIVTDGNLSSDQRHINITSKDIGHLEKIRDSLYLSNKITLKARGRSKEKKYGFLQFGDVRFYNYLLSIGLCRKKSLTLKSIDVPAKYFKDFLRGVIDGDGSINAWVHKSNKHEQWCLRLTSGALSFSNWLKNEIEKTFATKGKIYSYIFKDKKNPIHITKFGKLATKIILKKCYYKDCLALNRKFKIAKQCIKTDSGMSKYGNVIPC